MTLIPDSGASLLTNVSPARYYNEAMGRLDFGAFWQLAGLLILPMLANPSAHGATRFIECIAANVSAATALRASIDKPSPEIVAKRIIVRLEEKFAEFYGTTGFSSPATFEAALAR